jgi:Kdo2-lipid IVA lauroyltransferase/acyltransferase
MQRIIFYTIYPFLWVFSRLPFFVLHRISDFFFVIIYHLIGYRKKVVLNNLILAFPEKDIKELQRIRRDFFKHFVDIFIEMIKTFSISRKEIEKRYKYVNKEIFSEIEALDKSVVLVGAHYANWEWIVNLANYTNMHCVGAYTRITNPYFDKLIKTNRSRFGAEFVQTSKTIKKLLDYKKEDKKCIYGLLSDQSPHISKTHHWGEFLNVKVPLHTGAEMLAKKHDFAVVYMSVKKVKRSHYEISYEIMTDTPRNHEDYEITEQFLRKAEQQIYETPEYYFWTHKRFKYKDRAPKD